MEWINRYIDQPLLDGAANWLRAWHIYSGQPPERLEPTWHLAVLLFLFIAAEHFLHGSGFLVSAAALIMLALPSVWKLYLSMRKADTYGRREYARLRTHAFARRETEWSVRMTVLFMSASLPFFAGSGDSVGAYFLFGASIWFVLTAPVKFYLQAAEPPEPNEGDRSFQHAVGFG
ncbi:hypothetical protein ACXHXG_22275 [Rhizobium sp. LEGMi198b]|uniref:hypothetical protein n=1 Tax=unclassified Rhizobium TaxID=2613769 RepID=UPI0021A4220E|nr:MULTISPECIES: hypothetical protein [Rhizobium]MDK4739925.1 hypothetical protein [Rhizobium sp. CNPSo 3464]UWU25246.1 hypothetical protein N2601_24255 [Rhizobium tropici]WFU06112.1 hypothetical protein QA648_23605 [Rhizobium sp. CB3171]